MPLGREYPPLSRIGEPPVELLLIILVVTAFAALIIPSFVGAFIEPHRFKDRPTPPSLAAPKEHGRFGLPNSLLLPSLRTGRPSQPPHQPLSGRPGLSAPSSQLARRRTPETSA